LRSCKIKMKITGNEKAENFLSNTNQTIRLESIEPNRTVSIQSSSGELTSCDVLTNEEIRAFFKSLLSYVPISNSYCLDDLIRKNETTLLHLKNSSKKQPDPIRCLNVIHQLVLEAKQFGVGMFNLKRAVNEKIARNKDDPRVSIRLIKQLIDVLLAEYLVIAVGVVERVYVAHEFKQHWVIQSYKSLKGRGGASGDLQEEEQETVDCPPSSSIAQQNEPEGGETSSVGGERLRSKPIKADEELGNSNAAAAKNFKSVCLIPRPWRYIDGLLNRPVLKRMLESILVYLKTYPNVTFEAIGNHFCPVLQPIMTLELLEMLEQLKCVSKNVLKREVDCDLFSDFTNGSRHVSTDQDDDDDDLDGDEIFTYYLNANSIFTFKRVFSNSNSST
jgi:hypothetical protein